MHVLLRMIRVNGIGDLQEKGLVMPFLLSENASSQLTLVVQWKCHSAANVNATRSRIVYKHCMQKNVIFSCFIDTMSKYKSSVDRCYPLMSTDLVEIICFLKRKFGAKTYF